MRVKVTLQYRDEQYTFEYPFDWNDFSQPHFMFTEGNYSCDCNRSLFIGEYADDDFPDMPCGEEIKLIALEEST